MTVWCYLLLANVAMRSAHEKRPRPVEADRADVCPTKQTVTPLAIVDFALGAGVRL
jgi:hypothetical protein